MSTESTAVSHPAQKSVLRCEMLSDYWLKSVHGKARDKVLVKSDRDGLSARVTPRGKVIWQIRYRIEGKQQRLDLGTYPAMTLKQARDAAQNRRGQIEQGIDPRVAKKLERFERQGAITNEALFRRWYESQCEPSKVSAPQILRSFEIYVFPELGPLPADETSVHAWLSVLESVAKQTPRIADRVLTNAKQMHKWGFRRQLVNSQPLATITGKADLNIQKAQDVGRSLSDEEIRLLWHCMAVSRMAERSRIFIKLCLLFGCRSGEMREARKNEFDFDAGVWTIPKHRHKTGGKTGRPIIRPINDEAADMIKRAGWLSTSKEHLFASDRSGAVLHSGSVLSLPVNLQQTARRRFNVEMPHWSMHDLRKTARTNWSTLADPHICEIMLGHALPGVWAVYDRHDYLEEQRAAYQAWCERLKTIIDQAAL